MTLSSVQDWTQRYSPESRSIRSLYSVLCIANDQAGLGHRLLSFHEMESAMLITIELCSALGFTEREDKEKGVWHNEPLMWSWVNTPGSFHHSI